MMPRSVQHWPGGIPTCIQPYPEPDLSWDQIKEEVKGWLLFVQVYIFIAFTFPTTTSNSVLTYSQENWVSAANAGSSDKNYELNHRRELVEKWASATQEFRDVNSPRSNSVKSLKSIALTSSFSSSSRRTNLVHLYSTTLVFLAPIDEKHAANRARWVKFAILLYNYDIETGHCLLDAYMPLEAILNPKTTTDPSFGSIFLTQTGTVLYCGYYGPYMLVDALGLQTGRLTIVTYETNGTVRDSVEVRPLDMDLPIIDILCQAKDANQLPNSMVLCDREQWTSDVEPYAPGYLALEAEGRGGEYPLTSLTIPASIESIKKQVMIKMQDPSFTQPHFSFITPGRFP
ncbi:hypothetical protein N7495_007590 [Penicillium taxi]|uniref:uncharacterized protein n=1 Tax=Penicillium taxi TaxID=168475 RepID=UPI0025455652|nr:uncharacterized protein N7495_007590 [Penicillium taxi]KAJ5887549.1 hypothetical protein N7495_007590 [Penicillium taxi]